MPRLLQITLTCHEASPPQFLWHDVRGTVPQRDPAPLDIMLSRTSGSSPPQHLLCSTVPTYQHQRVQTGGKPVDWC